MLARFLSEKFGESYEIFFLGGTTGAVILRRTNYRRRAVSLRDT
nr:MAG TPA: hypothetical protein [Caudoviricetes sp.]